MLNDLERYQAIHKMLDKKPYASTYTISDANVNFLLRKVEEYHKLKKEHEKVKKINYELESQFDRITMVMIARQEKPILQRYYDIQAILGVDKFIPQGTE